jgi:hypothetical protein
MLNPLKIQEPLLLKFHNQVVECFVENNLSFEAEYHLEPSSSKNSIVSYLVKTNQPRTGFICVSEGRFGGAVLRTEVVKYLQKEGFSEESVDEEPIWSPAPCIMAFVCMLAVDRVKDLVFDQGLIEEFETLTKK